MKTYTISEKELTDIRTALLEIPAKYSIGFIQYFQSLAERPNEGLDTDAVSNKTEEKEEIIECK